MDDGDSWLLLQRGGGGDRDDRRRGTASYDSDELHHKQEEQEVISSQAMQQKLRQIYMLMDMEQAHGASLPSSSSSSFHSFSAGSRDGNSPHMLIAASTTTPTSCHHHHHLEVSSDLPFSPIAYAGSYDMVPDDLDFMYQEAYQEQARRGSGGGGGGAAGAGAFRPYSRSLSPRKKLKPGACGQRAIKTAIAIASRMHMASLTQHYQMEMAARPPVPATGSSCTQLQHVLSERKRREKLNDSFKALRTVLPPASKKDKTSILIRAKDYVNTLKSRVSELEEKNRMLVESQLHGGGSDGDDDDKRANDSNDIIEVDISRPTLDCQEFHLKIVLGSGCIVMDAVVGILQSLTERGDVSLVAMSIGSDSTSSGAPRAKTSPRPTVTFQLKSSSCDEDFVKESVIKVVKDVMLQSKKAAH